jgi:hypothetical protein
VLTAAASVDDPDVEQAAIPIHLDPKLARRRPSHSLESRGTPFRLDSPRRDLLTPPALISG